MQNWDDTMSQVKELLTNKTKYKSSIDIFKALWIQPEGPKLRDAV